MKTQYSAKLEKLEAKLGVYKHKASFPSLYLNIGKGYEDLGKMENAIINYEQALSFSSFLPKDGYGKMIRSGIEAGLKRISKL